MTGDELDDIKARALHAMAKIVAQQFVCGESMPALARRFELHTGDVEYLIRIMLGEQP